MAMSGFTDEDLLEAFDVGVPFSLAFRECKLPQQRWLHVDELFLSPTLPHRGLDRVADCAQGSIRSVDDGDAEGWCAEW